MYLADRYDLTAIKPSVTSLKFFFVSRGKSNIAKVVEYSFCQTFHGKNVYNLGFGDYDPHEETFHDESLSNNGDTYRVFHTVLHTVPLFFQEYPDAVLIIQGSDSRAAFLERCLQTCIKDCSKGCKKFNRRIGIYCRFVDKHFGNLSDDYFFYGGKRKPDGKILVEKYRQGVSYDAVMLERKIVNLDLVEEPLEPFTIMKPKAKKAERLSDAEILAPIISKFKDKTLFSRSVENAKKLLEDAEFISKH